MGRQCLACAQLPSRAAPSMQCTCPGPPVHEQRCKLSVRHRASMGTLIASSSEMHSFTLCKSSNASPDSSSMINQNTSLRYDVPDSRYWTMYGESTERRMEACRELAQKCNAQEEKRLMDSNQTLHLVYSPQMQNLPRDAASSSPCRQACDALHAQPSQPCV